MPSNRSRSWVMETLPSRAWPSRAAAFAELRRFQQGQEIVLYGQLAEDRRFLRMIADAVAARW